MGVIRHDISFDGIPASSLGLVIYGGDVDEVAAKDVTAVKIPGRNGVLHLDNHRYDEREQVYQAYVPATDSWQYSATLSAVRTTFGQLKGYKKLVDTFNPEEFALASFVDALAPESMAFRTMGLVELRFSCRPERFLATGEEVTTFTAAGALANPSGMTARPLIRVYGTAAGSITVGNDIVYIDAITGYIDLDSDLQDAFRGAVNCNGDIRLGHFPTLGPGSTGIDFDGGITSVEITPRWWRL